MQSTSDNHIVLFVARGTEAIQLQEALTGIRAHYDERKLALDDGYVKSISAINEEFTIKVLRLLQQTESRLELLAEPEDNDYLAGDDD